MIDLKDLYWTAGFIEGEGSFVAYERWNKNQNRMSRGCCIQANQVQKEPLERLYNLFGGRLYYHKRNRIKKNGEKMQDIWVWNFGGGIRGIGLAMTLFPLMSPKRQTQIQTMIALWKTYPRRGYYNRTHCRKGFHEINTENTKIIGGARICIPCRKERDRLQYLLHRDDFLKRAKVRSLEESKRKAVEKI